MSDTPGGYRHRFWDWFDRVEPWLVGLCVVAAVVGLALDGPTCSVRITVSDTPTKGATDE